MKKSENPKACYEEHAAEIDLMRTATCALRERNVVLESINVEAMKKLQNAVDEYLLWQRAGRHIIALLSAIYNYLIIPFSSKIRSVLIKYAYSSGATFFKYLNETSELLCTLIFIYSE